MKDAAYVNTLGAGNTVAAQEQSLMQQIIDTLDHLNKSLADANGRKMRILERVFGPTPSQPETNGKNQQPINAQQEVMGRLQIISEGLELSHRLISSLERLA